MFLAQASRLIAVLLVWQLAPLPTSGVAIPPPELFLKAIDIVARAGFPALQGKS